nr:vacuolar protein sorting-associated protein 60.2 [Tanacetum cinerariifolium]
MRRVFGVKKDKEPPPSLNDASDRINKRGESVDEKIKRLDVELARYKEQIKKTRPGPAQDAVKARAMRVLKQKRMYEGQRDMLYNQTFNLDQVAFASEGIKDAQQTMSALKSANKELKGMMKTVKIQDIDNLQDEMMDMMDISNEIQESLGRSYSVPDDIDEDELLGELDALEADMGQETESEGVPSYLQPDNEPDYEELNLPTAPSGHAVPAGRANNQMSNNPWLCGFIGFLWMISAADNVTFQVSMHLTEVIWKLLLTCSIRFRMEVVVRTKGQFYAFVKGAPEAVQERLNNLSALYVSTDKLYTRQGSHFLALTYKPLPETTDEGDVVMKPEGDDVVEGHGEAEVVVIVMVNYKRREVVESDSEISEENQYMDNAYEEIHHARSQRSPEEEKDEAYISVIAPEIRDVLALMLYKSNKNVIGRISQRSTTFKHGDEATRARIRKNKETVKCFKCHGTGHFANACPQDDTKTTQIQEKETAAAIPSLPEPKVSIKYPEFIHFRTRGIIYGTDKGSWDDFWYISNTSNKHMTADLKFFLNLKEEFAVEPLEEQGKFLFTYDGNKDGSTVAKEKERVEHFGITLEKEEEGKCDAIAHQDEEDMARIKCYLCQKTRHFDFECPNEDQRPTNGASTSRQQGEKDTHSSSSDDFTIIV